MELFAFPRTPPRPCPLKENAAPIWRQGEIMVKARLGFRRIYRGEGEGRWWRSRPAGRTGTREHQRSTAAFPNSRLCLRVRGPVRFPRDFPLLHTLWAARPKVMAGTQQSCFNGIRLKKRDTGSDSVPATWEAGPAGKWSHLLPTTCCWQQTLARALVPDSSSRITLTFVFLKYIFDEFVLTLRGPIFFPLPSVSSTKKTFSNLIHSSIRSAPHLTFLCQEVFSNIIIAKSSLT